MATDPSPETFLPLPDGGLPHPDCARRPGSARLLDHAGRRRAHRTAVQLSAGTLYSSIRRMLEQGLIEELSKSPDPVEHGRAAPLLPADALRPARRRRRSRAAQRPRAAGAGDGTGAGGLMHAATFYRALLRCYPAAFRESTASRCCSPSAINCTTRPAAYAARRSGRERRAMRWRSRPRSTGTCSSRIFVTRCARWPPGLASRRSRFCLSRSASAPTPPSSACGTACCGPRFPASSAPRSW